MVFVAVLLDLRHSATGENGDAFGLHLGADMRSNILIKAAQDVVAAIDHCHLRAEAGKDTSELKRNVAAALNCDALRQSIEMKYLIG